MNNRLHAKGVNPELIAALSAQVKTLSLIVAAESRQVAAHRKTHGTP
jgi:hypothetical protein